jgi:cobalt-zinc-cadmium efflux system outer membrane protein
MASCVKSHLPVPFVFLFPLVVAASEPPVTDSEAVRLFLEQGLQPRQVTLAIQAARAEHLATALPANPELAYQREDTGGVRDEFLTLAQPVQITGRRGLLRQGADAAAAAAGLSAEREVQDARAALRLSFYEVLYREAVLERLDRGRADLDRLSAALESREREGEGSGYDRLRAEQEVAEIGMQAAEAEAARAGARSRFAAFYAPERRMEAASLRGNLEPTGALPDPEAAMAQALARRADLRALRAEVRRLELEQRAAGRLRIPEPTLLAGWKRTEAVGLRDTGFVGAVSLPLPLFDRGRLAATRAAADRERTELAVGVLERRIRGEVQAALAREQSARQAAQRHGGDAERRAGELRRIATLAYEEGEAGILELLDAHRSSLSMELRALAVRYEVRRAEIEREHAVGSEVSP